MRWPYEEEDLLECINNEELPLVLVDIFEKKCPNLFYSGCVIIEVRDYRQSFPIYTCDTYHVLLKPTNQTLLADVNLITSEGEWTKQEKLALESQLILATAEPLCLEPNPVVGIISVNQQHRRYMLNTPTIRRQAKKFSQVAINRKRKTDQFTHINGLELSDFLTRYRQKPHNKLSGTENSHNSTSGAGSTSRIPKKPIDVVQPIKTPILEFPEPKTSYLPSIEDVEKYAKAYEKPKETKDSNFHNSQLIEQYILETDRSGGHIYHIKLSIFQRPVNSEFLGELYVDRDHKEGKKNGEACQFSLGTRAHANRYIQQFTEIFTEEGRKSVKITHNVPGKISRVTYTAGMLEQQNQQKQQQFQQQQQTHLQQLPTIQQAASATTSTSIPQILNGTNPNSLPGNQIIAGTSNNLIGSVNQQQQQQPPSLQQQIFSPCDTQQQTTTVTVPAQTQQPVTHQPTQLNLGSLVLVQHQSGNLTNLGIVHQHQNNVASVVRNSLGSSVPILVSFFFFVFFFSLQKWLCRN